MSTAFAILVVALNLATLAVVWLVLERRLQQHFRDVELREDQEIPLVVAPDPRVDELIRVVSTLKGAEALKQMFGKN